ncbi:hypothetical protein C7M52_02489 [Mixta theicola]|nr:lysis protein [Mixta theicola]QHM76513.1 hypothetical protein C7M52_02489 [Mixta theicola]
MIWLVSNWRSLLWFLLATCVALFGSIAHHYHTKYASVVSLAEQRQETINDMQQRQRAVAELDARYTQELADAQNTINQLRNDVADGRRRLQLNASCKPLPDSSSTGSLGNATTPTVTADAERDYWRLRAGIETVTAQVSYLQQYIREQCLK